MVLSGVKFRTWGTSKLLISTFNLAVFKLILESLSALSSIMTCNMKMADCGLKQIEICVLGVIV